MKLKGNLREREFIIEQQLLYSLDLMLDNQVFDRRTLDLRKKIRKVCIIVVELFCEVVGEINLQAFVQIMDGFNDDVLDPLDQNRFLIVHELETGSLERGRQFFAL